MDKNPGFMLFGFIIGFILIFSLGIISANILIAGKIYNSDYSNIIGGALVTVECDTENPLSTTSLDDGIFAVIFEVEFCTLINITTNSNIYKITDIKQSIPSDVPQTTTTSSGGGGGGSSRYYLCGNEKCDSGETSQTCLKDCPIVPENNESIESIDLVYNAEDLGSNKEETQNTENNPRITGGVIGFMKSGTGIGLSIAIVIILAGVGVMVFRNKKKTTK